MASGRFFSGSREIRKDSIAREIMMIERQKKGKLSSQERFKLIMKRRMEQSRKKVENDRQAPMSKKAKQALEQIAKKKAAKEAKIMRQSVIVEKKILGNGMVHKNGKIMDIQGNHVGTINLKNGRMATVNGVGLGKYKPKSRQVQHTIMDAINKYSPYYVNLRKMQALQAAGIDPVTGRPLHQEALDVHGNSLSAMHGGNYQSMGSAMFMAQQQQQQQNHGGGGGGDYTDVTTGTRQAMNATAWGVMSDNVWGTFSDNVWGTTGENVWGTASTDVWGGVGGNPWGYKTQRVWGTGTGVNHIKQLTNMLRKLFGRPNKQTVKAFKAFRKAGGVSSARQASAPARAPVSTPAPRGRR